MFPLSVSRYSNEIQMKIKIHLNFSQFSTHFKAITTTWTVCLFDAEEYFVRKLFCFSMKNNESGIKSNRKGSRTEREKKKKGSAKPPSPAESKCEKFMHLKTLTSRPITEETNQRKQSLGEETEQA